MEYLCDGSGYEGEGRTVSVKGRSFDGERGSPKTMQPGCRVIQAHGQFDSNRLVKNLELLVRKTKIS